MGGVKRRLAEVQANPELMGFEISEVEKGKISGFYWEQTIRPLVEKVEKEGEAGWEQIYAEYDQYSVREFLELKGWSEGMIEMFGLLNNQEAMMNSSFLELFREDGGNYYTNMCQIVGGADHLPHAFLPALGSPHPLRGEDDRHRSDSRGSDHPLPDAGQAALKRAATMRSLQSHSLSCVMWKY